MTTTPKERPMPTDADLVRRLLHAQHHPARTVPCGHCAARVHEPCTTRSGRRRLPQPHPSRIADWARATACCPACQVTPGTPCHDDGTARPGGTVHAQRYAEAERTAS